jgi:hypothetical protein
MLSAAHFRLFMERTRLRGRTLREWAEAGRKLLDWFEYAVTEVFKSAGKFFAALMLLGMAVGLGGDSVNTARLSDAALQAKAAAEVRAIHMRSVQDERDGALIGLAAGGGFGLASLGLFAFW